MSQVRYNEMLGKVTGLTARMIVLAADKAYKDKTLQIFSDGLETNCRYRAGCYTCAIGAAIPESAYRVTLEGKRVSQVVCLLPSEARDIRDLQDKHDDCVIFGGRFKEKFKKDFERILSQLKTKYGVA